MYDIILTHTFLSNKLFSRTRSDEIQYVTENGIPLPQDDAQPNRDIQQNLDALCLPRILDVKMTGAITHVSCLFRQRKAFFEQN